MPEETGCQLWGIMGQFLSYKPLTDNEVDAIQRRLFAFPNELDAHSITFEDIREIRTTETTAYFMGYLRDIINELEPLELARMFA